MFWMTISGMTIMMHPENIVVESENMACHNKFQAACRLLQLELGALLTSTEYFLKLSQGQEKTIILCVTTGT